jgi:hypothetical protein
MTSRMMMKGYFGYRLRSLHFVMPDFIQQPGSQQVPTETPLWDTAALDGAGVLP